MRGSRGDRLLIKNGGEAFLISEQFAGPIHLLLTDVIMPEMGGPELARLLARERPGLRVLFMSGYADGALGSLDEDDRRERLLAKPFVPQILARMVREVLGRVAP